MSEDTKAQSKIVRRISLFLFLGGIPAAWLSLIVLVGTWSLLFDQHSSEQLYLTTFCVLDFLGWGVWIGWLVRYRTRAETISRRWIWFWSFSITQNLGFAVLESNSSTAPMLGPRFWWLL